MTNEQMMRWETTTRYYIVRLQVNLFRDWEVMLTWGGKGTNCGRVQVHPVETYEQGMHRIKQVARRRRQRGYNLVTQVIA